MDSAVWTDKLAEFQKKFESGIAIMAKFAKWMIPGVNAKMAAAGHPEMKYIVMPIRLAAAKADGKNNRYELYNGIRGDETTGILKTIKSPERFLEVFNYMASEKSPFELGGAWKAEIIP